MRDNSSRSGHIVMGCLSKAAQPQIAIGFRSVAPSMRSASFGKGGEIKDNSNSIRACRAMASCLFGRLELPFSQNGPEFVT